MHDETEGLDMNREYRPFLKRNMNAMANYTGAHDRFAPMWNEDGLKFRIEPDTFRMVYKDAHTRDWWVQHPKIQRIGLGGMKEVQQDRKTRFQQIYGERPTWMKGMADEEAERRNKEFQLWVKGDGATEGEREKEKEKENENEKEKEKDAAAPAPAIEAEATDAQMGGT